LQHLHCTVYRKLENEKSRQIGFNSPNQFDGKIWNHNISWNQFLSCIFLSPFFDRNSVKLTFLLRNHTIRWFHDFFYLRANLCFLHMIRIELVLFRSVIWCLNSKTQFCCLSSVDPKFVSWFLLQSAASSRRSQKPDSHFYFQCCHIGRNFVKCPKFYSDCRWSFRDHRAPILSWKRPKFHFGQI